MVNSNSGCISYCLQDIFAYKEVINGQFDPATQVQGLAFPVSWTTQVWQEKQPQ